MNKISNMSALEISRCYLKKTLDPIKVTEYFLDKIYKEDKKNKIFVKITSERALNEAYKSKKRYIDGKIRSVFDGVPCAWKDIIDCKEAPAYAGSNTLLGRKAINDAEVISIANKAGILCLGKTSTVEFALGGIGTNAFNPTPNNLLLKDKKRAPGGSSVGSATAVFAGLIPIAIGTDTGGSVRIPAAWHGLIGFKPTYGKISTLGVLPLSKSLDTIGPISKSSKDIAIMYSILSKKKMSNKKYKPKDITIAICKNIVWKNVEEEEIYIYHHIINKIKSEGVNVIFKNFPEITSIHNDNEEGSLVVWEAWNQWKKIIKGNESIVDPNVLKRMHTGKNMSRKHFNRIRESIKINRAKFTKSMFNIDALIMPTVPIGPPAISELQSEESYSYLNALVLRNTKISNLLNLPSITIPIKNQASKAKGLLVCCCSGNDYKTLAVSRILEKIIN